MYYSYTVKLQLIPVSTFLLIIQYGRVNWTLQCHSWLTPCTHPTPSAV